MLVADTSVIAHLHVAGPRHAGAGAAYRRDPDWITVPLWRYELAHVLQKRLRAGHITLAQAEECMREAALRMVPRERVPDDAEALRLAAVKGLSGHDSYFAALALTLRLPLLTTDEELLEKLPGVAVSPEAFAAA
jgi:predicted nucleic acid-binding protein